MTELFKSFRYRKYLKNPFIGTHTPRLVKKTAQLVEVALYKGPEKIRRKSIFDIAQGFPNFAGMSKNSDLFQLLFFLTYFLNISSWKKISTHPLERKKPLVAYYSTENYFSSIFSLVFC